MGKNEKVFFILIVFLHFLQVIVHARTNAFAGSEKIFNCHYFIGKYAFIDGLPVLVYKREWFHLANRRYGLFGKARYQERHDSYKANEKQDKKSNVEDPFSGHGPKVISGLLVIISAGLLKLNFKHLYAKGVIDMLSDSNI